MCTGVEIALLAGAAASVIGQGKQQNNQARYRAALQRQQADRAQQEAAAQAADIRRLRSREESRFRARLAASGVDTSSSSALLALETLSGDTELEALTAINRGAARASGSNAAATGLLAGGEFAEQSAYLDAGTSLLKAADGAGRR